MALNVSGLFKGGYHVEDPPIAKALFSSTAAAWLWLVVRLYVGYEWLEAGLHKVSDPGWAKGISRCAWPPVSPLRISVRCSLVITPSSRSTPVTPSTFSSAAVVSRLMVSLSGQPATVSSTLTLTTPASSIETESTIPSSVMGRLISGS